ncbi:hypothetical protein K2173_012144 [Erythroxylum novogranatense]|uniref:CN hydrolase domain-containing protein n=1 Tax=Erythroxylum novogranatense TaxID=1862640 RepID=A0AAV8SS41_9ROSI|nr:hypothetical protein K2173_012144 [Erythroxylum novogranatense]
MQYKTVLTKFGQSVFSRQSVSVTQKALPFNTMEVAAETQPSSDNVVSGQQVNIKRKRGRPPGLKPSHQRSKSVSKRKPVRPTRVDSKFKLLRVSTALCSALEQLKNEVGLRSDGDTMLWVLHQIRPDLVTDKPHFVNAKDSVPRSLFTGDSLLEKFGTHLPVVGHGVRHVVRATVVQASTVFFDNPATLDKVERLITGAAAYGSQLVVFPEAFVGGYPNGVIASHSNNDFQKYCDSAISVPGPELDRLAKLAGKYKVHLVIGVVERGGSCLYSTALFFDSMGKHLGLQRKLMPRNSGEKSSLSVYKTSIGSVGGLICWDNRSPQLRTDLYDQGVEIYCAPTLDASEVWNASMTHIAVEGSCFVLSANQFCPRKDYPPLSEESDGDKLFDASTWGGGSVIVSPSGTILAGPNYHGECLISADLDFEEIGRAKTELGEVAANVGPTYLSWTVNESSSDFFVANGMKREVPDELSQ